MMGPPGYPHLPPLSTPGPAMTGNCPVLTAYAWANYLPYSFPPFLPFDLHVVCMSGILGAFYLHVSIEDKWLETGMDLQSI